MKRFYFVVVAGLCSFAPARAQEGTLAPTVPVVPAPVVQNGNLTNPGGGNASGPRGFALTNWSPFRNPATASPTDPAVISYPSPTPAAGLPPLPPGMSWTGGSCGTGTCSVGSCGTDTCSVGHNGSCWQKFQSWLCYHQSNTSMPRLQPTPYYTPLQGMFPSANCGGGCSSCAGVSGPPVLAQPGALTPAQPASPPMQPLTKVGAAYPGMGAVSMPARGAQGAAVTPTWLSGTTPAAYSSGSTVTPSGGVTNAGSYVPQR